MPLGFRCFLVFGTPDETQMELKLVFELLLLKLYFSGISLKSDRDQSGCEVKDVVPGGAVELNGRIAVGDHILSVNNQSLVGMNHQQVK